MGQKWCIVQHNRVRDSHAQLNGVRVRYNKTFPNGCRYPGDPSGRPEEVYNCRCTMVAITPNASQKKRTGNTVTSYKKWKQEKDEEAIIKKVFKNSDNISKIVSGARITDPDGEEGTKFAKMYYAEIRKFSTDVKRIAKNLGKEEEEIRKIKAYLFEDKSLCENGIYRRFYEDCAIAQSWQRLMIGENIKQHDRTLIEHELLEIDKERESINQPYRCT